MEQKEKVIFEIENTQEERLTGVLPKDTKNPLEDGLPIPNTENLYRHKKNIYDSTRTRSPHLK